MITDRLSGLLYQQPEEAPADPFAFPQGGMMLAQAKPQNKAYWDYRLKMNDFETPDEVLFQRMNQSPQQDGQRPQGQVGQTQIDPAKLEQLVQLLVSRGMPEPRARIVAIETLKRQGLMR
jgi:hypothetical protein